MSLENQWLKDVFPIEIVLYFLLSLKCLNESLMKNLSIFPGFQVVHSQDSLEPGLPVKQP